MSIKTLVFVLLVGTISCESVEESDPFDDLRIRAEQGDKEAQYELAVMYENGDGVPEDDAEAVKWYRKANDQGGFPLERSLLASFARASAYSTSWSLGIDIQDQMWLCSGIYPNRPDALRSRGLQNIPPDSHIWLGEDEHQKIEANFFVLFPFVRFTPKQETKLEAPVLAALIERSENITMVDEQTVEIQIQQDVFSPTIRTRTQRVKVSLTSRKVYYTEWAYSNCLQ
jgi:hypothetical protein